mgnify:CR=1 FL=1
MSIWICPIYPRINCFDKKVDIIIILLIHSFIYQFFFHIIHRKKRTENRKGQDEDGDDKQRKTYRRVTVIMPEPNKERDDKIIQDVIDIIAKDIARKCRKMI